MDLHELTTVYTLRHVLTTSFEMFKRMYIRVMYFRMPVCVCVFKKSLLEKAFTANRADMRLQLKYIAVLFKAAPLNSPHSSEKTLAFSSDCNIVIHWPLCDRN